ncbi:MAG: deoxyribose-phosphate aldolase [Ruminococcaceae bacterium]|nr:deoxyribose-phosphate aldolase [Oscillospiraceae bacterium]
MQISEILSKCDHTLLSQTATWDEISAVIDDGIKFKTASVCIPPSFVRRAANYADGKVKICTVIGFPNGYSTTKTKLYETREALAAGADEIDMVVNIGEVKAAHYDAVCDEIKILKAACGKKVLKVIIETCLLTEEEKIAMCRVVSDAGADYIKTSTGFSAAGATPEDIVLFAKHIAPGVKIKAAGGISSLEDAENFIKLGASRLGTSRIVKLAKAEKNINGY